MARQTQLQFARQPRRICPASIVRHASICFSGEDHLARTKQHLTAEWMRSRSPNRPPIGGQDGPPKQASQQVAGGYGTRTNRDVPGRRHRECRPPAVLVTGASEIRGNLSSAVAPPSHLRTAMIGSPACLFSWQPPACPTHFKAASHACVVIQGPNGQPGSKSIAIYHLSSSSSFVVRGRCQDRFVCAIISHFHLDRFKFVYYQ